MKPTTDLQTAFFCIIVDANATTNLQDHAEEHGSGAWGWEDSDDDDYDPGMWGWGDSGDCGEGPGLNW
ncbi:MAG TPA: hypothetical protein VJB82_00955 [Candidatus Peribacterales bacterium]|nr:hypothetical protein [Candidatus Peribacterales bacterium]